MDVPELSCSSGVGICECDMRIHCYVHFLPLYPFSSRERVLIVFYLSVFIFYYPKAIYKNGSYLYKTGLGGRCFFLERWHVSQQREKGMLHKACWQ